MRKFAGSHEGILGSANAVIAEINRIFPDAIDRLQAESGAFDGIRPQLLPDRELHNLSRFVKAAMGTEKNAPIAFGANQAVIVRNGRAKADLPIEFRDCLVLTVEESKGLEFNDVLIFNFFSDSGASINDWAAILDTREPWGSLDLSESRLGHAGARKALPQPQVDTALLMGVSAALRLLPCRIRILLTGIIACSCWRISSIYTSR